MIYAADIKRGDIVWASMDPTTRGREQASDRPHLVLSVPALHRATELLITVPLATASRPWPTRIAVNEQSHAVCEQPRTLSIERVRRVSSGAVPLATVDRVSKVVGRLIGATG